MAAKKTPMSYEFACRYLYPECDTKLRAETEEEVLAMARRHLDEHHGVRDFQDETVKNLRLAIRPA